MARTFMRTGQPDKAEQLLRQILHDDPGNSQATLPLVALVNQRGMSMEAADLLDSMRAHNPDDADVQRQVASLLAKFNRFEPAREAWRRVLELSPNNTDAYLKLALITEFAEHTDDVRSMEAEFGREGLTDQQRRPLAYALGKVFDDLGEYDRAFDYFEHGNRIARRSNRFTLDRQIRNYQTIRNAFTGDFFRRNDGLGIDDDSAIFVTGLGRSGTTLAERILAAHELVFGGGELTFFDAAIQNIAAATKASFPFAGRTFDRSILQQAAREYVRDTKKLSNGAAYITNKSVGTIIYIGMIRLMMPNAKLIVVNRDPRDQALSFFQKDFGNAVPCYYDLEELGKAYCMYQRLLEHWQHELPDSILAVQYEDIVADPSHQVRRLLEHCELEFSPACLRFFESDEAVSTMSLQQVRKPIYSKSVGRWKNYRHHLQPLLASLDKFRDLDLAQF